MAVTETSQLLNRLRAQPYQSYTYAYPHKTAYRSLSPEHPLDRVWASEDTSALFLYLHVPFCEHRCGFCNLFTHVRPALDMTQPWLRQLRTEAEVVAEALPEHQVARLAIGGGTPTWLDCLQLESLLEVTHKFACQSGRIPAGIEVSPATVTFEKLQLLTEFGVDRVSIGVQSFEDSEAAVMGRPQSIEDVEHALQLIRDTRFAALNIDLIYGGEGQTEERWLRNVSRAVSWQPEEIYLYPLYVRPLTGLGRRQREWNDDRLAAYRAGRDYLLENGYEQVSMRMFRRADVRSADGPEYCCQTDGMVGLGCGARSYTTSLHYSTEYAVGRSGVKAIVEDYIQRDAASFAAARHGFVLSDEEQRRRFLLVSLLQSTGLSRAQYGQQFDDDPLDDFPALAELESAGLMRVNSDVLRLTDDGLELSDAIGPWLYSASVQQLMEAYELN